MKSHVRTPLAKVRGLGSAREGAHHWWWQRLTALALIPLSLWLFYSIFTQLMHADTDAMIGWFDSPVNAFLLLILIFAANHHTRLGLQVIIEDYVHKECCKITMLIVNKLFFIGLSVFAALAIVKLHLG